MCQICRKENLTNHTQLLIEVCPYVTQIPYIEGLVRLDIIQCKNLNFIPPIKGLLILIIIGCPNIKKLPYIKSLKGLKLQCKQLEEIPCYENLIKIELHNETITKLPACPKLESIFMNHTNTVILPYYENLHELEVHNCKKLIYIPIYINLYKLVIQNCNKICSIKNINKIIIICENLNNYRIYQCALCDNNLNNGCLKLSSSGKILYKFVKKIENKIINNKIK